MSTHQAFSLCQMLQRKLDSLRPPSKPTGSVPLDSPLYNWESENTELEQVVRTVPRAIISWPGKDLPNQPRPTHLLLQGIHLLRSSGFTMGMRSRSQRTSTLNGEAPSTASASRRCSQRTRARTPVRRGTVLGQFAPRLGSWCKVRLSRQEDKGLL